MESDEKESSKSVSGKRWSGETEVMKGGVVIVVRGGVIEKGDTVCLRKSGRSSSGKSRSGKRRSGKSSGKRSGERKSDIRDSCKRVSGNKGRY